MMYQADITVDEVIDALVDFLGPFVGRSEIVRGQTNMVAMPPGECVILTEILQVDLSIPSMEYQPVDGTATIAGPSRIDAQMDFYGPSAGEYCKTVQSAFRAAWGFSHFPDKIKPLYTTDGRQSPLITGEQQYLSRWTLTASLQYNPTVTVPQQFADTLDASVEVPVDLT